MTGCACHSENGLISNAIEHVFNLVQHHQKEQEFTIKCAYLESNIEFCCLRNLNLILVYNEELHDLLLPRTSSKSYSRLELR